MTKTICMLLLISAGIVFATCESNNLYKNASDNWLSFLNIGLIDTPGGTTPSPTAIYIYNAGMHQGDLGGRMGADAICVAVPPPSFSVTTVRAFLSVSSADMIRDLVPAVYQNLPVYDKTGSAVISATWIGLWDGSIDMTLSSVSVLPAGLEWWNGSHWDGTLGTNNCLNWTSNMSVDFGMIGNANFTDASWINWNSPPCSTSNYLLCVAY